MQQVQIFMSIILVVFQQGKIMKKSLIIGVLAAIFSIPAYADFQYELGVDYFNSDTEVEN